MEDFFGVALRISFSYLYILALLRLSGKRSIGHISPLDFLVALILGDLFDDIFWAEVPLAQGVVALAVIVVLHTLVEAAEAHSSQIRSLVSSTPTMIIEHAAILPDGMRRERTNDEELWSLLRIQSEDDLAEVREARFEPDGEMSMLPTEAADVVRKQDAEKVRKLVREVEKP